VRIATLGPAGTFSELAASEFAASAAASANLQFYPSLQRTLAAVGVDCEIAVVPLENIVEGVVSPVIDGLLKQPLQIIAELSIPVRFSLVANHHKPQRIYAQFVAQGQCSEALARCNAPIISTASNTEALHLLLAQEGPAAALVPEHTIAGHSFAHVVHDVTDVAHNQTRFIVLQPSQDLPARDPAQRYKSAIIIVDDADHPGLLVEHLQAFALARVNLTALVSRPTGQRFGAYHFFIELEGHVHDANVQRALALIKASNQVIELGSYSYSNASVSAAI
jgi:prephenate dehydratase